MSECTYETLLLEEDDNGIATVTVNRPDKLNALNFQVLSELEDVFSHIQMTESIVGVIITGAGDKAFVAGADIKELADMNEFRGAAASERGQEIFSIIENTPKPVVAAIEGYALGGGFELALSCHLRVASASAVFGLPEVTLGLIPGYGGTQRLSKMVGKSRALEMILTGNHYKADVALAFGVINKLAAPGEAMKEARSLMDTILSRAPIAIRNAVKAVMASDLEGDKGYIEEADRFGELCGTTDFREGIAAFLEKRAPKFTGN